MNNHVKKKYGTLHRWKRLYLLVGALSISSLSFAQDSSHVFTVQEAVEAPNVNTYQLYLSLGGEDRKPKPGSILLNSNTPEWTRRELIKMGYKLTFEDRTSGPVNAIYFDRKHGTFWGGSSNHGEDYGVGW